MKAVKERLEELGEKAFMVDAKPGQSFAEQTLEGLGHARALVAFCTEDYGQKTGVGYETFVELQYAYENQLPIVPLKLSEVYPPEPPEPHGRLQNKLVFKRGLVYIEDQYMEAPKMVARKIASSLTQGQERAAGYPKSEERKEGRKEDCQHDMQKLNVHMCFLYNGPKKHGDQEFLTCTKCQKTFHAENRRELVNCPWDPQGKQYADKQKSDARKEVEECEMRNSTLDGQIQLQDGQNSRARLNFDGHSSFHPWLKVYQNNFVGSDTEFHINKVNYQGNQVFLELDEPCFGGLKHSRVEFLMLC